MQQERRVCCYTNAIRSDCCVMDFAVLPKGDFIVLKMTEKDQQKYPGQPECSLICVRNTATPGGKGIN